MSRADHVMHSSAIVFRFGGDVPRGARQQYRTPYVMYGGLTGRTSSGPYRGGLLVRPFHPPPNCATPRTLALPHRLHPPTPQYATHQISPPQPKPKATPSPLLHRNPTMSTVVTTAALPTKPRRVPPPCWTQDEARSLILAYRDRWFALRRANLKSADWDHVAAATAAAAPSSPPKTALQCRHKMEKLRKRYRAEKQRASGYPGRFSSSWALFHLMDEMESGPDRGLDSGGEFGGGFSLKARNLVKFDGNVGRDFSPDVDENSSFYSEGDDYVNQGFRPKSNGKADVNLKHSFRKHGDYGVDIRSDRDFVPAGFRPKSSGIVDGNVKRNVHFKEFDGYSCLSGSKFVKKSGVVGIKRDVDPVEDLASSIMRLGEGFVRMEKMKMEMTMEIEKMRMEMELKRNEAMIESHQQIVDAFVNALLERKKKKKAKVESSNA